MKTNRSMVWMALALASPACIGDDAADAGGVATLSITADDMTNGVRPVVDLTMRARYFIDSGAGPIDLQGIDVREPGYTGPLADWLVTSWDMDPAAVHRPWSDSLQIERVEPSPDDVAPGRHEEALSPYCKKKCTNSDCNDGYTIICEIPGNACPYSGCY